MPVELADAQRQDATFTLSAITSSQGMSLIATVPIQGPDFWGKLADNQTPFEREKAAFHRRQREWSGTYAGRYVAIHSGDVAASGQSAQEAADIFFSKHGDTHVYIGFVGMEPPARQILPRLSR